MKRNKETNKLKKKGGGITTKLKDALGFRKIDGTQHDSALLVS